MFHYICIIISVIYDSRLVLRKGTVCWVVCALHMWQVWPPVSPLWADAPGTSFSGLLSADADAWSVSRNILHMILSDEERDLGFFVLDVFSIDVDAHEYGH